jgi:hypothetical protein
MRAIIAGLASGRVPSIVRLMITIRRKTYPFAILNRGRISTNGRPVFYEVPWTHGLLLRT